MYKLNLLLFLFTEKIEESRMGVQKGIEKGVQKGVQKGGLEGGARFCLRPMKLESSVNSVVHAPHVHSRLH